VGTDNSRTCSRVFSELISVQTWRLSRTAALEICCCVSRVMKRTVQWFLIQKNSPCKIILYFILSSAYVEKPTDLQCGKFTCKTQQKCFWRGFLLLFFHPPTEIQFVLYLYWQFLIIQFVPQRKHKELHYKEQSEKKAAYSEIYTQVRSVRKLQWLLKYNRSWRLKPSRISTQPLEN
jgi:hypothetical protein